jgi:hypothetical protein
MLGGFPEAKPAGELELTGRKHGRANSAQHWGFDSMTKRHEPEYPDAERDRKPPTRRLPAEHFRSAVAAMVKLPPLEKRVDTLGRKIIQRRQRRGGDFGSAL